MNEEYQNNSNLGWTLILFLMIGMSNFGIKDNTLKNEEEI